MLTDQPTQHCTSNASSALICSRSARTPLACSMAIRLVSEACSCAAAASLRRTCAVARCRSWRRLPGPAPSAAPCGWDRLGNQAEVVGVGGGPNRCSTRSAAPPTATQAASALSRFGPAAGLLGAPCWKKDVVGSVVSAGRLMPPDKALSAAQRRLARSELGPHHRARHHGVRR